MSKSKEGEFLTRLLPIHYLHVLDLSSNVTRLEIGPKTFVRKDNEEAVFGPAKMVIVPPQHYCIIENPVATDDEGQPTFDASGQVKLLVGDESVRLSREPFPLHPGEILKVKVTPLRIVPPNVAILLKTDRDFTDDDGTERIAGDEWLFEGPGTYIPKKGVAINEVVKASVILPNQALRLRAKKECADRQGVDRVTGEEWLVKNTGAYLPGAYEEVLGVVSAHVLTEKLALHMRCLRTFTDDFGHVRKNGEEWLITMADTETHIPNVYEEVVRVVDITTLTNRQYCVILNPVDAKGRPQLGRKKLEKGEKSFFLMPGESLEKGIQDIYVLTENEGLILRATEEYTDEKDVLRRPGDRWMIRGPEEYVPDVTVEVECKRLAIPLDVNEGIYVRNIKTGKVRAVTGETYMLSEEEQTWEKDLPKRVEKLLGVSVDEAEAFIHYQARSTSKEISKFQATVARDKTRIVSYRVPHNAAVQIYDYKEKKARVVFGPELVMLGPDEQFTQLSLSGGKPKRPNVIKSLDLMLGPDFCTDIIVVETADHARLSLQLSYNWRFKAPADGDQVEAAKLFSVPDFVGDACKAVASRVRGSVAAVQFDDFHKNSARIIRSAVFGFTDKSKVKDEFVFPQNNLVITSIDIQSVEPVDQRTRDSLQKSVQLAIEITTNSQEASARQEAERLEQQARGRLERQKIVDEAEAEKSRKSLLELQASSAAVESTGQAKAEAQSRAEAARIEGEAAVEQARLKAQASNIEAESELERLKHAREAELSYLKEQYNLELNKMRQSSEVEVSRYDRMVKAIGTDTLKAIAAAGPDMEVKLLQSLGLKTTLITDGSSPINLFSTAHGLIGRALGASEE